MRIIIATLLLGLLMGCSPVSLNAEDLMRPPQLSQTQSLIYDALLSALGTTSSGIALRYPRSGDYRSAFIFKDLDGDGTEEVMAFYSHIQREDEINVNIMRQDDGRWYSVYDTPGGAFGVESVDFTSIAHGDGRDIVIGWGDGTQQVNQMSVLRFEGNVMDTIYQGRYTEYITMDFNGDGLEELMTVSLSSTGGRPYATLVEGSSGTILEIGSTELNLELTEFASITGGGITPEHNGVVVDGWVDEDTLATEVILVENGSAPLVFAGGDEFYSQTLRREEEIYSEDINGDSIIEIPVQTPAPEHEQTQHDGYYTTYSALNEDFVMEPVLTAYINIQHGYTFYLPDYWVENTVMNIQSVTGELSFWAYDTTTEQTGQQLLSIRAYSQKDYQDRFDLENYHQIGQKGNFIYDAYIQAPTTGDYALSLTELENLFYIH